MERHPVSQALNAANGVAKGCLPAAMVEVVAAKVLVGGPSAEHVVDGDQ